MLPGPGTGVAPKDARLALDLNEEESHRCQYQQINLVDAAIVGDEFEIRPGTVWLPIGEQLPDIFQGLPLPRETRFGDSVPMISSTVLDLSFV